MMLQKLTFSTVTIEELKKAGIKRKRLSFELKKIAELIVTKSAEAEISDLYSRIKKIYARVNMDVRLSRSVV